MMTDRDQGQALAVHEIAAATAALVVEHDVIGTVTSVLSHCVRVLGATSAGVIVVDPDTETLDFLAATSHQAEQLELLQVRREGGPALEVIQSGTARSFGPAEIGSLWPELSTAFLVHGVRCVHASPMGWQGRSLGALNLCFAEDSVPSGTATVAGAFADIATLAIVIGQDTSVVNVLVHLRGALADRAVIEQAKGVLAQRYGISVGAAFDRLVQLAADTGRSLTTTAQAEIDSAVNPGS